MTRVGILGGTFDPVHLGHLIPAEYAFNHLRLDRLILAPAAAPVHRPRHVPAPAEDRLAMCRLAASAVGRFEVSDAEVHRAEPSYTVLTLRHFAAELGPRAQLVLLVGEDNLPLLHTWYRIAEIVKLAEVAVMPRPDSRLSDLSDLALAIGRREAEAILARRVDAPLVPVSATEVRQRAAAGRPLAGLVPGRVAAYIASRGLYGWPRPGGG